MLKSKIALLGLLFCLGACDKDSLYKSYTELPKEGWAIEEVQDFEFRIDDKTKQKDIKYLLRSAVQYPFYNLYLKTSLKDSTGKVLLEGMEELIIFDPKTGRPKGDGLGDLFDQRVSSTKLSTYQFPYNGVYTLSVKHNMRPDLLVGLLGVGLEINNKRSTP